MDNTKNTKKIAVLTGIHYPDIGGPASFMKSVVSEVAKEFNVEAVTYSNFEKVQGDDKLTYKLKRVVRTSPKIIGHIFYFLNCLMVSRKADLIIALSAMNAGLTGVIASKIFKKPLVVRVVGDYAWEVAMNTKKTSFLLDDFQKDAKRGWIGLLHKIQLYVCNNATKIIVPSEYLRKIVSGWGVDEKKIVIINNGINMPDLHDISQEEARKEIGISGRIILSVGRLVPWKGHRMLIKIMPSLLQWDQYTRLVIVGDGPDEKLLQNMIINMGLERKVFLVGRKSHADLLKYLKAADVFALHTGYEGFSHQIVEAMACGLPVVTTDIGGNSEIITNGKNGFLVGYNEEFELTESIRSVLQSNDLREQFIIEGLKTASQFSVKKTVDKVRDLISSLL